MYKKLVVEVLGKNKYLSKEKSKEIIKLVVVNSR